MAAMIVMMSLQAVRKVKEVRNMERANKDTAARLEARLESIGEIVEGIRLRYEDDASLPEELRRDLEDIGVLVDEYELYLDHCAGESSTEAKKHAKDHEDKFYDMDKQLTDTMARISIHCLKHRIEPAPKAAIRTTDLYSPYISSPPPYHASSAAPVKAPVAAPAAVPPLAYPPAQGYPAQGYPAQGYPAQGYPAQPQMYPAVPTQNYAPQTYAAAPQQAAPAPARPPQPTTTAPQGQQSKTTSQQSSQSSQSKSSSAPKQTKEMFPRLQRLGRRLGALD